MNPMYRTTVAFYAQYGQYVNGRWEEGYTEPVITKVNIQPFKDGEMLEFNTATTYYQKGYKKVYFKEYPVFPENPPEDSQIIFYYDGLFYQVQGDMNYTTPGKGPKHYKALAAKMDTQPDIEEPTL